MEYSNASLCLPPARGFLGIKANVSSLWSDEWILSQWMVSILSAKEAARLNTMGVYKTAEVSREVETSITIAEARLQRFKKVRFGFFSEPEVHILKWPSLCFVNIFK